jgi:ubiquitin-protein ligase
MEQKHYKIDEDGHIHVQNLSAYWIPELTVTEVIHGTTYVVTGSYEGTESFLRRLERITSRNITENLEECQ